MFLFFGEMPVDIAFMQALCECEHQQGRGYADVEALGESMHGYLDIHVGMFERIVGEACLFGAEHHCDWLVERQCLGRIIILVRAGGDYFIAFAVQIVESFGCIELIDIVFVQVEPFGAAHHDVWVDVVNPFIFDDMYILHAGKVAASQNSAGIMRLINVFKHYCEVSGAVIQHLFEASFSLIGDIVGEKFV